MKATVVAVLVEDCPDAKGVAGAEESRCMCCLRPCWLVASEFAELDPDDVLILCARCASHLPTLVAAIGPPPEHMTAAAIGSALRGALIKAGLPIPVTSAEVADEKRHPGPVTTEDN